MSSTPIHDFLLQMTGRLGNRLGQTLLLANPSGLGDATGMARRLVAGLAAELGGLWLHPSEEDSLAIEAARRCSMHDDCRQDRVLSLRCRKAATIRMRAQGQVRPAMAKRHIFGEGESVAAQMFPPHAMWMEAMACARSITSYAAWMLPGMSLQRLIAQSNVVYIDCRSQVPGRFCAYSRWHAEVMFDYPDTGFRLFPYGSVVAPVCLTPVRYAVPFTTSNVSAPSAIVIPAIVSDG